MAVGIDIQRAASSTTNPREKNGDGTLFEIGEGLRWRGEAVAVI
jgi:hypothetical protein